MRVGSDPVLPERAVAGAAVLRHVPDPLPVPLWRRHSSVSGLGQGHHRLRPPVMANVAEIVRGAVQSISSGQWEAADSLAFTRRQTMWMIILPPVCEADA